MKTPRRWVRWFLAAVVTPVAAVTTLIPSPHVLPSRTFVVPASSTVTLAQFASVTLTALDSATGPTSQTTVISLSAGDRGISQAQLDHVAALIQRYCVGTLLATLGELPRGDTDIRVYSTAAGYSSEVARAFPENQVEAAAQQTCGFTSNSQIVIPLYQYNSDAVLVNTLAHELVHAIINESGLTNKIPLWFNEGVAWYAGTEAEEKVDSEAVRAMNEELAEQVHEARQDGLLEPLDDDGDLLSDNLSYNREFQDYLGVQEIIHLYGREELYGILFDGLKIPQISLNRNRDTTNLASQ